MSEKTSNTIPSLVMELESKYTSGNGVLHSKYVTKDMYEDINTIDAYLNSKHTSGEFDSLGREKPFFNIVVAGANIWYRATEIKLEKIKVRAIKQKDVIDAFLMNVLLQDWFKRENFKNFLSEWGRTLSRYGSAIPEFVEKDGRLIPSILQWNRVIVDPIDFDNNPKIKVLELTEAQLSKNKAYNKEAVKALCGAYQQRELLDGKNQDNKSGYIKVYEIHGEFSIADLKLSQGKKPLDGDDDEFVQQMHVVSFVQSKDKKGEYDEFTLYSGREKNPHMITHLIKEDGQTLSIGAVQYLFQNQWMVNHTAKMIKDQLDLASKLIFQTADDTFVGENALSSIETGDILIHKPNMPLTNLANNSHDIGSLQSYQTSWKVLGNEIIGISESMLGNTAPSGTAWRQIETLLQENHSLFQVMKENKGMYLEQMLRTYVIPFLKKKMDTSEEVASILDDHDLKKIDSIYIKNKAIKLSNKIIKERRMNGQKVTPEDRAMLVAGISGQIEQSLSDMGNQRFFKPSDISDKTWKEQFKDIEWDLDIDTMTSSENNDAVTTLNTLLQFFARKQGQPLTPEENLIVGKILNKVGEISPAELSNLPKPTPRISAPQVQPPTPTSAT